MNLIPKLLITIADDGKSFVFADNTLEDNQSVSTNYWNGTSTRFNTNISLATTDLTYMPDKIYQVDLVITDPSETDYEFSNIDVPVSSREKTILNTEIGQSGVIPDGVYTFKYYILNSFTGNAYSGNDGDYTLTWTTAIPPSLEVGMFIRIGATDYYITDITGNVATLDQPLGLDVVAETAVVVGYSYVHYEVFDFNIACCIDKAIAAAATNTSCGDCISDELKSAVGNYILLKGAKAQAKNGMPSEAQTTVELISTLCANGETDCGC